MYKRETYRGIDYYRVENDVNGIGRAVVRLGDVPFRDRLPDENWDTWYAAHFAHACKALNGKRYRAQWFGGGVVFQTYNLEYLFDMVLDNA